MGSGRTPQLKLELVITRALLSLLLPCPHWVCSSLICSHQQEEPFPPEDLGSHRSTSWNTDLYFSRRIVRILAQNLSLGVTWLGNELLCFYTWVRLNFLGLGKLAWPCKGETSPQCPQEPGKCTWWVKVHQMSTEDHITSQTKLLMKMISGQFCFKCLSPFFCGWFSFSINLPTSMPSPG